MRVALVVVIVVVMSLFSIAEDKGSSRQVPDGNTVCTFGNGEQISIRYPEVPYSKDELPRGKAWAPDNQPMYLFSQTELEVGATTVPPGAYSLYVIPGEQTWSVVLNKGVEKGSRYDPHKDLAKLEAQTGELPNPSDKLTLYFGRISPAKCTLRMDYGKKRAFTDFRQK